MTTYLEQLHEELVAAGERLTPGTPAAARARRWGRTPRVLALGFAGLAVSATALAATAPWHPLFGDPSDPRAPQPRITAEGPPQDQQAVLGVLRRPQSDQDRGLATRQALRFFGPSTQDVRTAYIRILRSGAGSLTAVLVPARIWDPGAFEKRDVVCLFVRDPAGDGGGKACFTTTEIRDGLAGGSIGAMDFGLVPDGVASVAFHYGSTTSTAEVHDNFYEHAAPAHAVEDGGTISQQPGSTTWLDARGRPTPDQPRSP